MITTASRCSTVQSATTTFIAFAIVVACPQAASLPAGTRAAAANAARSAAAWALCLAITAEPI